MKRIIYNLAFFSIFASVLLILNCKKEPIDPRIDPRDEIVGIYFGTMEYKHSSTEFMNIIYNFDTTYQVSISVIKKDSTQIEILHDLGTYEEPFAYNESNVYTLYGTDISSGFTATFTPELYKLEIYATRNSFGGGPLEFDKNSYNFEGYKD